MYRRFKWTRPSRFRNELTRAYEPIQPLLLKAFAKRLECNAFIDVGANIGAYSLFMSDVEGIGEIHAFEPAPDTFGELVRNIELNGLQSRILVHQKALSNSTGAVKFGIVNRLSGANSILSTSIHSTFEAEVEVETVRLDDHLPLKGRRLCIKIDVEGHEREALDGMASLLGENQVLLQVETYGEPVKLANALGKSGLRRLCGVGPDCYFSNFRELDDQAIISAFEEASGELIQDSLKDLQEREGDGTRPVQIDVGSWASLQLRGAAARAARKLRHPWRT